jgi:nitrite reductase (NADH) large subunit
VDRQTLVIVGNGMVSHRLCASLRELDADRRYRIVVLGEEPRPAYDRVHLTSYFEDSDADKLLLADAAWYAEHDIDLRVGCRATELLPAERTLRLADGSELGYDVLALCTGSAPFVPQMPGIDRRGVFVYRTIEDLDAIMAFAKTARSAAVLGGGLLGLEAARAVQQAGLTTHVIEVAPRLMPRQLDESAAGLLRERIEELGVEVLVGKAPRAVIGEDAVTAIAFGDGSELEVDMVIVSAGIRPRDELARGAGLLLGERGGVLVDDAMRTSDPNVFALGEVALHRGIIYGLVAPGYAMADVVAKNLLGEAALFEGGDLSAKLKLMGVEVASFGDPFCAAEAGKSLVFHDVVNGVYKKIVVSADAKRLLGGILIGDASQYPSLVFAMRSGQPLPDPLDSLILGDRSPLGAGGAGADAAVCVCNNVSRSQICERIRQKELCTVAEVKQQTKAGTGCGACLPLVSDILNETLLSLGKGTKPRVCEHFAFTRQELFETIAVKGLRTWHTVLGQLGEGAGCEVCKPVVASILASLHNDLIVKHATIQDTNDRFLANIQRGGLYSVVPRIPAGEITPEKLIKLGEIAQKYGLYTKITGGQRIDLFGARVEQLPNIWEELVEAGFESGHAYGKSMRTVKSCVGSTWCRYGVQDSVAFAIRVEERYKGIRSPHKLKSAVSGCTRECAEAQSKDFGIIATEKGWNLYVCGNGGMKPRHADLLASDLDSDTCIRYIDRFLMFYMRTADKLMRTSVWLDKLEGGIEHLRDVVVNDSLGVAADLERQMQALVDTFKCEWAEVVHDPKLRAAFHHFANTEEGDPAIELVPERGQRRPADWDRSDVAAEPDGTVQKLRLPLVAERETRWVALADAADVPQEGGIAVRYGRVQLAIFNFTDRGGWYASQNMCPHRKDMVLARGLIGDQGGTPKVACPMHKKTFALDTGKCLSDDAYSIATFPVKVEAGRVLVLLPPATDLEPALCPDHDHTVEAAE